MTNKCHRSSSWCLQWVERIVINGLVQQQSENSRSVGHGCADMSLLLEQFIYLHPLQCRIHHVSKITTHSDSTIYTKYSCVIYINGNILASEAWYLVSRPLPCYSLLRKVNPDHSADCSVLRSSPIPYELCSRNLYYYPVPDTSGDRVLFSIDFFVCMYVCIFVS